MSKYLLTQPFFDGTEYHEKGEIVDLGDITPPKNAKPAEDGAGSPASRTQQDTPVALREVREADLNSFSEDQLREALAARAGKSEAAPGETKPAPKPRGRPRAVPEGA